ncbi:hypothetical protein CPC197_2102 [Chlamydia psittaci C1/97]|nr:hypothetical protein CPC197_2102 [Chlamydia psittaci C1/97]
MRRCKSAQAGQNRFEPVWSGFRWSKPLCGPLSAGLGWSGPV